MGWWRKRTSDWEVRCDGGIGAGWMLAGCLYQFTFRASFKEARVLFMGYGLGVGGNGASGSLSYTRISVASPFSFYDLNWCPGRLTTIGAAAGGSLSSMHISAGGTSWNCFQSQQVGGFGVGAGAGGMTVAGLWKFAAE